jgi:hypothetical protein
VATVPARDDNPLLEEYARVSSRLRLKYRRQQPRSLNTVVCYMWTVFELTVEIWGYLSNGNPPLAWLDSVPGIFGPMLATFMAHGTPRALSTEEIKLGFVNALDVIKDAAREQINTEITSAAVLGPAFFDNSINLLVRDAADEVGILAFYQTGLQAIISLFSGIFDESAECSSSHNDESLVIIDYESYYLDIELGTRNHRLDYPSDVNSCYRTSAHLEGRLLFSDVPPRQQVVIGASYTPLFSVVHKASVSMKEQRDSGLSEDTAQSQEAHEWPVHLHGGCIDEYVATVLRWEDVLAANVKHGDGLEMVLDPCKYRLRARIAELQSIDAVIILGNSSGRALVHRAVHQSIRDHVQIVEGHSELDVAIEAKIGARLAFEMREAAKRRVYERKQLGKRNSGTEQNCNAAMGLKHDEL